jgi:hypothetical protein
MKPSKHCLKKGGERGIKEYKRESEVVQSTLYASRELPQ